MAIETRRPQRRAMTGLAGVSGVCGLVLSAPGWAADGLGTGADTAVFAPTGADTRVGDVRAFVEGLLGGSTAEDRAFTFTPSIQITETATDNVRQVASPRVADLITAVTPQLAVSGQTSRIEANLLYAPSAQIYARSGQQDQVVQNFNGQALLTAVPDTVFLSLRGYSTQQSASGAYGQSGAAYGSENRSNVLSFDASPYVQHRFGGWGTLQAGYAYDYTSQTGASPYQAALTGQLPLSLALLGQTGNSITRSSHEFASFATGENFGRVSNNLQLDNIEYSSSGGTVLDKSYSRTAIDDFGYAINHIVAVLGSVGYEDIAYSGTPAVKIADLVWSGGLRLTPNETSSITLRYGHKDGFASLSLNASYAVTERLRVFAEYSEGLSTSQQEIQNDVANSTIDQYGNTISTVTGAPTLVAEQLLAPQGSLYKLKRLSATAVSTYDRDVLSLTVEHDNRTLVADGPGTVGYSDQGVLASLNWSHDLTPALTGTATLRYSRDTTETTPASIGQAFSVDLQLSYMMAQDLTGRVEYLLFDQSANGIAQAALQNAVIVSLSKTF